MDRLLLVSMFKNHSKTFSKRIQMEFKTKRQSIIKKQATVLIHSKEDTLWPWLDTKIEVEFTIGFCKIHGDLIGLIMANSELQQGLI